MKNIYKISFNDLNIPNAVQIFKSIIRISRDYDKKFFLIGALARDILLETIHKRPVQRATLDIDFGVVLSGWHQKRKVPGKLFPKLEMRNSGPQQSFYIPLTLFPLSTFLPLRNAFLLLRIPINSSIDYEEQQSRYEQQ